jgi:hypothetical protein
MIGLLVSNAEPSEFPEGLVTEVLSTRVDRGGARGASRVRVIRPTGVPVGCERRSRPGIPTPTILERRHSGAGERRRARFGTRATGGR